MSVKMDKIGTTFYGDDEVKTAREFRQILSHQGLNINRALKIIIKKYIEDFSALSSEK